MQRSPRIRCTPWSLPYSRAEQDTESEDERVFALTVLERLRPDTQWELVPCPGLARRGDTVYEKTGPTGWNCATRATLPLRSEAHEWSICIEKRICGVSVGVSRAEISHVDVYANTPLRFDVFCGSGEAVDVYDDTHQCLDLSELRDGADISVRLNPDSQSITFGVNGRWNDTPTFSGIGAGPWYPYVVMHAKGATIRILD